MSELVWTSIIVLGSAGLVLGLVLFFVARKFAVHEDPRISQITELLPGANCGGCGFPGCSAFAAACVAQGSLKGMNCSVSKADAMESVALILGAEVEKRDPKVAVVRCNGSCENRPQLNNYDGVRKCAVAHLMTGGETGCFYGCLGCGDCVDACKFGAIKMNMQTGLPEVDQNLCTACGACVTACPRSIIELRNKNNSGGRVYVGCVNRDKGPVARKACAVACIGCGKCVKVCTEGAIALADNLAYIDYTKCGLCGNCVENCPQRSILAVGIPAQAAQSAKSDIETI